jgi:hypothetical protein
MSNYNFATEEDRVTAINALGDDPSKLSELEEIRSAELGVPTKPDNTPPEGQPLAAPIEPKKDDPFALPPIVVNPNAISGEPSNWNIKKEELPGGYKTPGELFKAFKEAQELIQRQTTYIKTNLGEIKPSTTQESEALRRAEAAESELARLRGSAPSSAAPQVVKTTADISSVQAEIARIEELQNKLEKQVEGDQDFQFTAEYAKSSRELSRMQTKNLNLLTGLYTQARTEIGEARSATSELVNNRKQQEESASMKAAVESKYKEMSEIDIPEYKLSKSAKDVEAEYISWRGDVALAYYGRPATSNKEMFDALKQLQNKNPELISRLQLQGLKPDPTEDVKRYMVQCEMLDYQEGWRKDPVTGENVQLLKMDPRTGKQVPLTFPTLKAAIQQKRLEEGYYEKQRDAAFQNGAQTVAQAAQRRDMGAIELDNGSDMGQTAMDTNWAIKVLTETDSDQAMIDYRRGKPEKFDLINKARKAMGQEPITFE